MLQPKKKSFNQIKIHSQYSICEGALKIENLKEYCKKNKIQSVGLSDTYNLSGALEFSENISSVGTQPIIGSQIQFRYKNTYGLIPLIAKNYVGYKNIILFLFLRLNKILNICLAFSKSRLPVGSSARIIFGSFINALAIAIL